jgi:hypothetical protein
MTTFEGDKAMTQAVMNGHVEAGNTGAVLSPDRVAYFQGVNAAGSEYFTNAMGQFDNLGYEEREAKAAMAVGFLLRSAVLLSGPAGGLKSTLSETAWQIFSDINPDAGEVALVPTAASLKDIQMVGGTIEVMNQDDTTEKRTITGIFNGKTKYGWVDEGNRVGNFAMNSLLDLPEKHKLKAIGQVNGYTEVPEFQAMATTMNPSDSEEGLFHMSKAMVARHIVGVIMGRELSPANRSAVRSSNKTSGKIEPITSTRDVRAIQQGVIERNIPAKEDQYLDRLETAARTILKKKYGIVEGPRLTEQLGLVTKSIAVFNGGSFEEFGGIDAAHPIRPALQAVRFALGSRIGGLSNSEDLIADFDESMDEVQKTA